jgi:N-acetyl-anhydromuramyl-L-alanine amidase AmpD
MEVNAMKVKRNHRLSTIFFSSVMITRQKFILLIFIALSLLIFHITLLAQQGILAQYPQQEVDNILVFRQSLPQVFQAASREFEVPFQLLEAIAFVESRWVHRVPEEIKGEGHMPPSYGVMGLRDDDYFGHSLREAAKLLGLPPESLKQNFIHNIRGAAALLKIYADSLRKKGIIITNKLEDWKEVVEKYSGIPQPNLAELYAYDVFNVLKNGYEKDGIKIEKLDIDISIFQKINRKEIKKQEGFLNQPDYPPAHWVPAHPNNYGVSNRPSSYSIDRIVIHTGEGSYAAIISWFQNPNARVSAHYVIRSSDGDVTQMVEHKDIAYHAGNYNYNLHSIGIELEGYADDPSYFTQNLYSSLTNLVKFICNQHGIPKNRVWIIGHNEVPSEDGSRWGGNSGHYDPGGYFCWDYLITLITGQANTYQVVKVVNTSKLNVRVGPGVNYPILTTVSQNQKFVSYYSSSGWYLIFIPGGNSKHFDGWVSGSYISIDYSSVQLKVVNVWPLTLRVRTDPTSPDPSNIIDKVSESQRFVHTGNQKLGFDGYIWYEYYLPEISGYPTGWSSGAYLKIIPPPVEVKEKSNEIPSKFTLYQNYPNPFNPTTTIEFDIPERTNVKLVIYDILGREIETLIDKELEPGKYKLNFTATNLPSGVYFYTLKTPKSIQTKKMLLIK